ncbi:MAG: hypothetical protein AB7G28_01235 [Pirellulales bacterium]
MQHFGNRLRPDKEIKSYKRCIESRVLQRAAHADVFEVGVKPRFLFVLCGGSGVDEEEYVERSKTVIPVFGRVLEGAARDGIRLVLMHVTAPYDVPFNRFSTEPSSAVTWNAHVLTELLEPWPELPYFVAGFSGGTALALNGLHAERRCFGAAAMGADGLPRGFACPEHWNEKLRLYVTPQDTVCSEPTNREVCELLTNRAQAEVFRLRAGGHRLADYSTAESLGELIRFANRIAPTM